MQPEATSPWQDQPRKTIFRPALDEQNNPGVAPPVPSFIVFSKRATARRRNGQCRETRPQGVAQVVCIRFSSLGGAPIARGIPTTRANSEGSGEGFRSFFEPRPDLGAALHREENPKQAQNSPKKAQSNTFVKIRAQAASPIRAAGCRSRRRSGRACLACSKSVSVRYNK